MCCEPVDVRAKVCPHCGRQTWKGIGRELLARVVGVCVVLALAPCLFSVLAGTLQAAGRSMFPTVVQPARKGPPAVTKAAGKKGRTSASRDTRGK